HEADAVAQRDLDCLHALAVHARIGVVDLHLVVEAAARRVALRLADDVLRPVVPPAPAAVGGHAVGDGAPELAERQPRRPADDVPESDADRADAVGGDALALDAAVGAEHALPQAFDEQGILTDDERLEAGLEIHLDGLRAPAAEGQRVAEAV